MTACPPALRDEVAAARKADESYRSRRAERYAAQRIVWRIAGKDPKSGRGFRWAFCKRVSNGQGVRFWRRGEPGAPGTRSAITGLQTCGSVWSCPVCSEVVNAVRQAEVETAVTRWLERGNEVTFATLTLKHRACTDHCRKVNKGDCGHSLKNLWAAAQKAWSKVQAGRGWGDLKAQLGIEGSIRLVEVKHGAANGWHPHFHVLFFHGGKLTDDEVDQFRELLFGRWSAQLGKVGLVALEFDQRGKAIGADVRRVSNAANVADYVTKNAYRSNGTTTPRAVAYEVTGSHSKKAGKGGRTPFQVLADLVDDLDGYTRLPDGTLVNTETGELSDSTRDPGVWKRDLAIWREWEAASKGKRQLVFSRGLRDMLGLGAEKADEEIADNSAELDAVEVVVEPPISDIMSLTSSGYCIRRIVRTRLAPCPATRLSANSFLTCPPSLVADALGCSCRVAFLHADKAPNPGPDTWRSPQAVSRGVGDHPTRVLHQQLHQRPIRAAHRRPPCAIRRVTDEKRWPRQSA